MTKQKNPILNPSLVLREEFDDWAILFDPESGQSYGLNPVSVAVCKHLDGQHQPQDIVAKVKAQCSNVPEHGVEEDICAFITLLEEKGLVGYECTKN